MNDSGVAASFKGRPLLPANIEGQALVTSKGFDAYAAFYNSLLNGVEEARAADSNNQDLFGKLLTNKIVCVPKTTGSTPRPDSHRFISFPLKLQTHAKVAAKTSKQRTARQARAWRAPEKAGAWLQHSKEAAGGRSSR